MILDELFEGDLPPNIKKSDLPPGQRSRLTMRDIEAERPKGVFRFRVTPKAAGESPKDFLDRSGAEAHARAVGGQVEPIGEQPSKKKSESGTHSIQLEKKKPQPTNAGLWSRAKAAAKSKFDVYPSAYANAWAAKWYKAKGGGWRMGKDTQKD